MMLRILWRYLRGGHVLGRSMVLADLRPLSRAFFLHSAFDSGLLAALRTPRTRLELMDVLRVENEGLLDGLLDLGLTYRELRMRSGRYSLRGRRSRALAMEANDAYAAVVQEYVSYHGSVHVHFAQRMRGAPLGDYMETTGELIARSSRIGEPASAAFLNDCVRRVRPKVMFDVGCGSGVYLKQAADAVDGLTGIGVDVSSQAAAHARDNVRRWGLEDRIRILCGDVFDAHPALEQGADLVTLFHNLYYFDDVQRKALFPRMRELVRPGGALGVLCLFRGRSRLSAPLDIVLRSTKGNTGLPDLDATVAALEPSGFRVEEPRRLIPFEPLYGLVATAR